MIEQKKIVLNLSTVLAKSEQYYALQPKATFWFGAVLSFFDQNYQADLVDDLSSPQKVALIRLITQSVASFSSFYEQERPNSIFRVFTFMSRMFDLNESCTDYGFVLSKVTYLNALALYSVKVGQYSYSLEVYDQILDIYNQKLIDNTSEIFLTILSNYLTLLKKSSKKMASKLIEVEGLLKELFFKFLTKFILIERESPKESLINVLSLLSGIFHQHELLLDRYEKDLSSLITHFYQESMKTKRKLPQKMIDYVVREKIRKNPAFELHLNQDQLHFYSSNRYKDTKEQKKKKDEEKQGVDPDKRIKKMENMLEQTIQMLQEQKILSARHTLQRPVFAHSVTLNRNNFSTINKSTIQSNQGQPAIKTIDQTQEPRRNAQRIQPLPRSVTKRRQLLPKQPTRQVQKWGKTFKSIKFKIYSIFVDVIQDGVLLSDYTNQNKRYIEWNTVSLIMEKLQAQFVFEDFIKSQVQNYYDIVRILAFYLTKNDNREICLMAQPIPLLEINSTVRLYKQEGKYLKLALMDYLNNLIYVGISDLYISQYSEFFKQLSQNEYMMLMNDRISSKVSEKMSQKETFYNLDYLKRKRETTVTDLSKFLEHNCLQRAIKEGGYLYKCILLLKNNTQILVQIADNIKVPVPDDYQLKLKVQSLQKYSNQVFYSDSNTRGSKIDRQISIPFQRLTEYFPLFDKGLKEYLSLYSKMIVDTLSVQNFLGEVNLGGITFSFTTHVLKTEMIQYGKYFSVVTAELVGSKERIWALVIKLYDMAHLNYKMTVMMNPYHDFLENTINGSKEEQSQVMRNLLIGESVKDTVNWLKKNNKFQIRMNLFEYLSLNRLI